MSQSYDRVSLWGFYQYDNNVLSTLHLPSSFTSEEVETIKSNIIIQSAELELYYTDLNFLKFAIDIWSKKKVPVWERMKQTLEAQYNPIENYDRMESWSDESTGESENIGTSSLTSTRDTTTNESGSSETENSGTSSGTVSGTTSGTTSGTEAKTTSGTSETDSTGSDTSTGSSSGTTENDSTTTNSVMGANPNEGWADHDKSVVHGEGETHTSNSGLTETETHSETTTTGSENITTSGISSGTSSETTSGTTSDTSETTTTREGTSNEETESTGRTTNNGTSSTTSTHTGRLHGNIGITTNQSMVLDELSLRAKYNIMDIITNDFIDEFCLRVY